MAMLCRTCGKIIKPHDSKEQYHPECAPTPAPEPLFSTPTDPDGRSELEVEIRDTLTEIIEWGARSNRRSTQVNVGPSELGTPCDRELGYRLAGLGPVQEYDPFPAIVGTATHTWMEKTVNAFEKTHGLRRFRTEMRVSPDPLVTGSTDVYWEEKCLVLDWKFPGPDGVKTMRKEGFSDRYRTQLNLYGLGHIRAGRPVTHVGIVALSRSGTLRDMLVLVEPYDEAIAVAALKRMYRLGQQIDEQGILDGTGQWSKIGASPSRLCGFCRMYRSGGDADNSGCPGR